jgi:hypothetical protein
MAIQWHPLFARLLRPLLEEYYDVQTNVPVGDVPREADLVILRRTAAGHLPFRGLWQHLRPWNVMEYKGPSVSARLGHIDLLVELGLGIQRRLNSQRAKFKQSLVPPEDVCFWYMANHLGKRFRHDVVRKLGGLENIYKGVWRGRALDREVLLISGDDLPVETDSLPLHILRRDSPSDESALAKLVMSDESLWEPYAEYLGSFHPGTLKELLAMARTAGKAFNLDIKPIIEVVGLKAVLDSLGVKRVVDEVGVKRVVDEVGLNRVIDEVGKQRVLDQLLDQMSPQDLAKLQRRLAQGKSS